MKPILTTSRLNLRPITLDDTDALMELFSDAIAMRYFPGTKSREETIDWINKIEERYNNDGYSLYACIKNENSSFIGYCGLLLQKDVDRIDETEVGYGLIRKFWHQGFATEAAIACRDYGLNHFGFNKIISLIRPENIASNKVAERNGMVPGKEIMRWGYLHRVYRVFNPNIDPDQENDATPKN